MNPPCVLNLSETNSMFSKEECNVFEANEPENEVCSFLFLVLLKFAISFSLLQMQLSFSLLAWLSFCLITSFVVENAVLLSISRLKLGRHLLISFLIDILSKQTLIIHYKFMVT